MQTPTTDDRQTPIVFSFPVIAWRAIDGDTIRATLDLGFGLRRETTVRLAGYDSPEAHPPADDPLASHSRMAALNAADAVRNWIAEMSEPAGQVFCRSLAVDAAEKFGRVLGDFTADGNPETLVAYLLRRGFGRAYHGEKKAPWEKADLYRIATTPARLVLAEPE